MNPRKTDAFAREVARGLRRYKEELRAIQRQNRGRVLNLRRDGNTLSHIVAQTPRVREYEDELAAAIVTQWVIDAIEDIAPEEADIANALLRSAREFELNRRAHDRLVAKLDPHPFAEVLTMIAHRLPPLATGCPGRRETYASIGLH